MDLGVAEEFAHLLADDKKWAEVKTLTVEEIKEIVGQDAEEIKVLIESASLPEIDDYITEMFQSVLDSIGNPDEESGDTPLGPEYGTLFDEKIVIKLLPKQVKFLAMYEQEGPDDEHFEDPSWELSLIHI